MKKRLTLLCTLVLILSLLTACGQSTKDYANDQRTASEAMIAPSAPMEAPSAGMAMDGAYTEAKGYDSPASPPENGFSEKMIYTANATIQTRDFDGAVETLYAMMDEYGAYLDSSSVSGRDYYYGSNLRYATFTVRIPVTNFGSLTTSLDRIGNVLNLSQYNQNITEQFYDAQSRLDTYQVEEERILEMLKKAETVSDMLELEARLSDIRYQIESLESRLRTWQKQVDYSTVTIYLQEVEELTVVPPSQRTYLQRLGDSFLSGIHDAAWGLGEFILGFVEFFPTLVILALLVFVIVLIVRKILRRRRERKAEKKAIPPVRKEENNDNV